MRLARAYPSLPARAYAGEPCPRVLRVRVGLGVGVRVRARVGVGVRQRQRLEVSAALTAALLEALMEALMEALGARSVCWAAAAARGGHT